MSETVPDSTVAVARLAAQKRRNLVLALGLVAFAILIGLVTGVRLSEATHREAAKRAAEAASTAKVQP
jgi:ethanolamine utilization microcompartment shell protein EutS